MSSSRNGVLLRAAALGAASGSRSTAGITAVALSSGADDQGAVAPRLGTRSGSVVTGLLAAAELVGDKLPSTPSRLGAGLAPRLVLGATSAATMARRDGHDPVLPLVIGLGGAGAAAVLLVRLRAAAAARLGSDRPGAFAEDGLAALLGWFGARRH
jgi:uncharacterized membrane protein